MAKSAARTKTGLSVKTYSGLNKKRMASRGGGANAGVRVVLKDGDTVPVIFAGNPKTFKEFDIHQFQEDGRWHNVPCLGDGCPLCDDESDSKSKVRYRFIAQVYNLQEKKPQILDGPKDLAQKIMFRYGTTEKSKARFLKRPWEIVRFPTQPVTYACDKGDEDDMVKINKITFPDMDEYLINEAKAYYGEELPSASSLDADDDDDDDVDDDDADEYTEAELKKKTVKQLKAIAKEEGVSKKDIAEADDDKKALIALIVGQDDDDDDEDDEDDDDDADDDDSDDDDDDDDDSDDDDDDDDDDSDDDDDDEDDDDDDDEDVKPSKKSSKKPAKKAPAKKAAPKKTTAKKGKK